MDSLHFHFVRHHYYCQLLVSLLLRHMNRKHSIMRFLCKCFKAFIALKLPNLYRALHKMYPNLPVFNMAGHLKHTVGLIQSAPPPRQFCKWRKNAC